MEKWNVALVTTWYPAGTPFAPPGAGDWLAAPLDGVPVDGWLPPLAAADGAPERPAPGEAGAEEELPALAPPFVPLPPLLSSLSPLSASAKPMIVPRTARTTATTAM